MARRHNSKGIGLGYGNYSKGIAKPDNTYQEPSRKPDLFIDSKELELDTVDMHPRVVRYYKRLSHKVNSPIIQS
jgi:hypothetical protein